MLVCDEKLPRHFWRMAIIKGLLPSTDSEIRGAIVRIPKTNAVLKRPVNKLFTDEDTYHDTNQTDNAKKQKLRSDWWTKEKI